MNYAERLFRPKIPDFSFTKDRYSPQSVLTLCQVMLASSLLVLSLHLVEGLLYVGSEVRVFCAWCVLSEPSRAASQVAPHAP